MPSWDLGSPPCPRPAVYWHRWGDAPLTGRLGRSTSHPDTPALFVLLRARLRGGRGGGVETALAASPYFEGAPGYGCCVSRNKTFWSPAPDLKFRQRKSRSGANRLQTTWRELSGAYPTARSLGGPHVHRALSALLGAFAEFLALPT